MNNPIRRRLMRTYRQRLQAEPARIFPLLCPEREKEWLPGWDARMLYSESGVAEAGAVFATPGEADAEVIWLVAEYRPPQRLHLVRWHPASMLVDIELALVPIAALCTALDVRYIFTATAAAGCAQIELMTLAQWEAQMQRWQDCLNAWLATHPA